MQSKENPQGLVHRPEMSRRADRPCPKIDAPVRFAGGEDRRKKACRAQERATKTNDGFQLNVRLPRKRLFNEASLEFLDGKLRAPHEIH